MDYVIMAVSAINLARGISGQITQRAVDERPIKGGFAAQLALSGLVPLMLFAMMRIRR